ncbi:hypothetical protein JXA02_08215 [candidate division KSB1 bacterium]|nr:hypothetical protein [candidate division KSB1 bacterium]RQW05643.1 MAG: hypothetical protein EH222_09695 [candidate division KSB1 bacterium]
MILTVLFAAQFAITSDTKKLLLVVGVAFFCVFIWQLLVSNGKTVVPFFRKFLLACFFLLFLYPYLKLTSRVTEFLVKTFDLNYVFGKVLSDFKGTDWADGILSAGFFFFYIFFAMHLWNVEKKASKPPDKDKDSLKINATIGNKKD